MARLLTIAVLVAVIAGAITIAAGGVDPKLEKHKRHVQVASADRTAARADRRAPVGGTVSMRALAYTQPLITVKTGRTVRFVNRDDVAHTVYASLGGESGVVGFQSPRIRPHHSYRTPILAQAGVYSYFCTLHPTVMRGVIRVIR